MLKGTTAEVEIQFNWMFVLIAGALVLIFIVSFVSMMMSNSDKGLSAKLLTDMKTILTQASVSIGKSDSVTLTKPLQFDCDPTDCSDQGCPSGISVPGSGVSLGGGTPIQSIFSSGLIKGRTMVVWSMDWNMPFRATNFLYVTSVDVRYVFVKDTGGKMQSLYGELPPQMTKELTTSPAAITNRNNYKVRLVSYASGATPVAPIVPAAISKMPNKDVTAIVIVPGSSPDSGTVMFYEKSGASFSQKGSVEYAGMASLYGAVFSDTKAMYECNMMKALTRLSLVSKLYAQKVRSLSGSDTACTYDSGSLISSIATSSATHDLSVLPALYQSSLKIKEANNNLKLYSCPLIY